MEQIPQIRGLTTLQLLEAAAIIIRNQLARSPQLDNKGNAVLNQDGSVRLNENVRNLAPYLTQVLPGIPLPEKVGIHVAKDLSKKGGAQLFNNGTGKNAFRASSVQGQQIEQMRPQIYNFVAQNAQWIINPAAWPDTFRPAQEKGGERQQVRNAGSPLQELFSGTGYKVPGAVDSKGKPRRPENLQEAIQGFAVLWRETQPNQEPGDSVRSQRVGGGFERVAASENQAAGKVAASNGFLNAKVEEFMNETRAPGFAATPGTTHSKFKALEQQNGGPLALSQMLWDRANKTSINRLLGGFGIAKPQAAGATKREYQWAANAQPNGSNPDGNAADFTRAVYQALYNKYSSSGQNGDAGVDPKSTRAHATGARGLKGVADASLKGLNMGDLKKVATFGRNVRQGQYSVAAMQRGAQMLGIQVDANALLPELVRAQIRNGIIVALSQQIQANQPAALLVAQSVLGGQDYQSSGDVYAKLDAEAGLLGNVDCNSRVLNKKDIRRIAQANGIQVSPSATHQDLCDAIANVQRDGTQAVGSDRRGAEERKAEAQSARRAAASPATSGSRSGRRAQQPLLQQLAPATLQQLSPKSNAAFNQAFGQQRPPSPRRPSGGRVSGTRTSGGRSPSPSRRGVVGGNNLPGLTIQNNNNQVLPGSPQLSPRTRARNQGLNLAGAGAAPPARGISADLNDLLAEYEAIPGTQGRLQ